MDGRVGIIHVEMRALIQFASNPPPAAATAVITVPHAMSDATMFQSQWRRMDMLVSSNVEYATSPKTPP